MRHFIFTMRDGSKRTIIAHNLGTAIKCGRILEVPRSVVSVPRIRS